MIIFVDYLPCKKIVQVQVRWEADNAENGLWRFPQFMALTQPLQHIPCILFKFFKTNYKLLGGSLMKNELSEVYGTCPPL